ncbi:histidinol-phosphate transaminase [Streptomyces sp. NPDC087908]|uniref:histidinol-phosphate transaminase n=1 Tax=Streptomyces sp. NPDC087908 TaxID=3365820 RepID=UPI003815D1A9
MSSHFRSDIVPLPGYQPIPDRDATALRLGIPDLAKLDTNEMPYGPLPGVREAVTDHLLRLHHYPDLTAAPLTSALAAHYRLDPDTIAVGNGSAGLIEALVRGTTCTGDEVVFSWRSFEAYPLITTLAGAVPVPVPRAPDHGHDLPALLAAITPRTRLLILCNPSNPTGVYLPPEQVESFLDQVPAAVLVVLDEAYREFAAPWSTTVADRPNGTQRTNTVTLRSFSKAWGLAGLRVGWAHGAPELVRELRKCLVPFSVSSLAQVAAVAALREEHEMYRRVDEVIARRTRIAEELLTHAVGSPPSRGNFLWLPKGARSRRFADEALLAGFLVRAFDGEGVRITVGTEHDTTRLCQALPDILRRSQ